MLRFKLRHRFLERRNGSHRMLENVGIGEQFKLFIDFRVSQVNTSSVNRA